MRIEAFLDEVAVGVIKETLEIDAPALLRPTQDAKHGDYQLNAALALAKRLKRSPRDIAQELAEALVSHAAIATAEVAGPGFVNLRLSEPWIASRLAETLGDRQRDGVPSVATSEVIVVDFSSPNIAKQMHVGHLRSTIIGDAVIRLLRFVGHEVVGDNHLGDWGTQFGLLIVGMREWGSEQDLEAHPVAELERVYKLASARAKEDEAFADAARAELAKLQSGEAENRALWERFVAATRQELDKVYARLDVRFDAWLGESAYHDMLPGVVDTLLSSGLAREDQGALCVFFSELEGVPAELKKQKQPFIIRKKDGAYLYSTTDIATMIHRKEHFKADRSVYVVDSRQGLHFKQLFALTKLMGVDIRTEHIGFGMMLGEDGRPLRTRDGGVFTLASLLDEAEERAGAHIRAMREEGKLKLSDDEVDEVARVIGVGAVKYADLRQNRNSDYQFDWDKMIAFRGNAGPYLQYAYARTSSILERGGVDGSVLEADLLLEAPQEKVLARSLLRFGEVVHQAAESGLPHLLTDHLYEVARGFSAFYEACPVLKEEGEVRASRLALVELCRRQIRRGLGLLGIQVVDRM